MKKSTIISFAFLLLLSGIASATNVSNVCVSPPRGLVGWWPGDDNPNDIASNNNGTFTGSYQAGEVADAFSITTSNFVNVAQNAIFEPQQITVDAWVKANGSPGQFKYIVAKGSNGCAGSSSYAIYTGASGGLFFYVSDGTHTVLSPDFGAGVWDNSWHFVAGTYDGQNVKLYVDGNLVGSTPSTSAINYSLPTNDLTFGNYVGCTGLNFQGGIDEVEVYKRALALNEIKKIYTAGANGKCKLTPVSINIKPAAYPNCFDFDDRNSIPVAIYGSASLDVTTINLKSLHLNEIGVDSKHHQLQCSVQLINNDTYPDLLCQFDNDRHGLDRSGHDSDDLVAVLTGTLNNNTPITGTDSVCVKHDDN